MNFKAFRGLCFSALLCASYPAAKAQIVINEIMQSNIDCIMDDLNDFPDSWVELYNTGSSNESLAQYSLGLSDDPTVAWHLPSMTVAPNQYVLIYCDKVGEGYHADFRLDSGKGSLYLFKETAVADKLKSIKKQPAPNIAYGRATDGGGEWGYMLTPTPGNANNGGQATEILGEPIFSIMGGVRASSTIRLQLSLPEGTPEGTEIRYTLDGSEPTASSSLYSSPIVIRTTKAVRAKLFCQGYLSPRSTVQSYILLDREQTLPVVSIVTDEKYLTDNKIGIYVEGNYNSSKKNYEYDWRRPINIELYETDGTTCVINQLCETRIQGGASRDHMIKSLALYANKRFGEKRFSYEFFPDQRPGQTNFKSLILRNAGNDFDYLYMRDAIIQRTMTSHVDLDWQAWRPAIVYINGVYKGIENFRERSNEDNIFTNYEELEDIDMIENWWDLKTGTWDNYNAFKDFYTEHGHTMAEYQEWMDTEEFINLMAMNLFYDNRDFPGNNIAMWRPTAEGGKWRWIAKDTDFGLGLYGHPNNYNDIEWIYDNNYDPSCAWANGADATRLFRRLMEDPDFQREFIDHCAVYMGDFMNERGTREVWDPMYDMIKTEYPIHRAQINQWWPNYNDELNKARNWIKNRPTYFYNHLNNYYKIGAPKTMKVNQSLSDDDLQQVDILFNGIKLSTGRFDGKFFLGRAITLDAIPGEKDVIGWRIKVKNNNSTTETEVMETRHTFNMPSCTSLEVEAILGTADGIEDIRIDGSSNLHVEKIYDIQGQMVNHMSTEGLYLLKMSDGTTRKVRR